MLQKALSYLVSLKDNKTYEIEGKTFSDHKLELVEAPAYHRANLEFGSLDAIVKMVKAEIADYTDGTEPIFIRVEDHKNVDVFTRPDDREKRTWPYSAKCVDAEFKEGWRDQQSAIIELRSRFIPTEDSEYLVNLISRINNDHGVQSTDNGVSQTVVTKQGVSLMNAETVKPRLTLKPFRTFREVPQPESEFILRLDEDGRIGLFEADGGIWKMEAKDNIKAYLEEHLGSYVESGVVIVMV
jgi:hypothetical protein